MLFNLKNIDKYLITKLNKFKDLLNLSQEDLEFDKSFIHFHERREIIGNYNILMRTFLFIHLSKTFL